MHIIVSSGCRGFSGHLCCSGPKGCASHRGYKITKEYSLIEVTHVVMTKDVMETTLFIKVTQEIEVMFIKDKQIMEGTQLPTGYSGHRFYQVIEVMQVIYATIQGIKAI